MALAEAWVGNLTGAPFCYRVPRPSLVSFSGGRTSAMLLYLILRAYGGELPPEVKVVFANTGLEHEATLRFVQDCSDHWGVEVTWVEFDPEAEHSTRIVTFETASRDGRPLKAAIDTRPTQHLFNAVSRYCTGTTKHRRIQKYASKWLGWSDWYSVRGIRADEAHRARKEGIINADHEAPIFPLVHAEITKEHVSAFWQRQNFDLALPDANGVTPMGNCQLCPLKSRGKLINILRTNPNAADWWIEREMEMEDRVRLIPRRGNGPELRHRFFKTGESFRDLVIEAQRLTAAGEPMDQGYEPSIDCLCTD